MKLIRRNSIGKSVLILVLIFCLGCKKIIEIDPPVNKIVASEVFDDRGTVIAAMTGIYASMAVGDMFSGPFSASDNGAVLCDESDIGPGGSPFLYRDLINNDDATGYWKSLYSKYIFNVNSIIEGVTASKKIDDQTKKRVIGEAKFVRAFCYFYLVNFYGDVPLALGTDFKVNNNLPRVAVVDIYKQIVNDLQEAEGSLTDNYLGIDLISATDERIRPNKFAASALLARVYLYTKDWKNAELESSKVISNATYALPADLNVVFLKNSPETIWQLQPNQSDPQGFNTLDGRYLIPFSGDIPNEFASSWLLAAFEPNDKRKTNWLTQVTSGSTNYPMFYKYKIGNDNTTPSTEYVMVLRLAEQYLIRAEARAQQQNFGGAASDLNTIRNRAGLPNATASDATTMATSILKERQTELFHEWANRWFDLKRTNKIDQVMSIVAPTKVSFGFAGTWASYKALLPIPVDQFTLDPALKGHQNPGYSETP